jgi:hypothetical protein
MSKLDTREAVIRIARPFGAIFSWVPAFKTGVRWGYRGCTDLNDVLTVAAKIGYYLGVFALGVRFGYHRIGG